MDEALNSIYTQQRPPEEVVLVCDGPITQNMNDILKKYRSLFIEAGIDFINPKLESNSGLGVALKYGVGYCTKEYIVRMDSDDISTPDRLTILEDYCKSNPSVDVVGTYIEEFATHPGDLNRFRYVKLESEELIKYAKKRNPMNHVTVCMKKEALIKVGNYENILWHEDYYLWMKMISEGVKLKNIAKTTVHVRVHGFGGRRLGMKYIQSELAFLNKCQELDLMNTLDKLSYLFPRIWFRILPSKVVEILYKFLRKVL